MMSLGQITLFLWNRLIKVRLVFLCLTLLGFPGHAETFQESGESCPSGSQYIKGQTAVDHCAFDSETQGYDIYGNDVCRDLGGFKEYQYRLLKNPDNYKLYNPPTSGDKTIICEQEQLPVYDDNQELVSCPDYTFKVAGHSDNIPDHCTFIDSHVWYGIAPELDEQGKLVEVDICWNLGRSDARKRLTDANGITTLLCTVEDFAHAYATELAIKEEKEISGLSCEQPGQEYIAGNSIAGTPIRSHCAWQPSSPNFIGEGLDTDNIDVCGEQSDTSYFGLIYNFNGYIYRAGVKTIDCTCSGYRCPSIIEGERFKGEN